MRTLQETGTTIELVVPQDSIRRNDDGSWTAHITDVANMACTNYSYKVRIDPSAASIRFQNPASLQPVTINGPSLSPRAKAMPHATGRAACCCNGYPPPLRWISIS